MTAFSPSVLDKIQTKVPGATGGTVSKGTIAVPVPAGTVKQLGTITQGNGNSSNMVIEVTIEDANSYSNAGDNFNNYTAPKYRVKVYRNSTYSGTPINGTDGTILTGTANNWDNNKQPPYDRYGGSFSINKTSNIIDSNHGMQEGETAESTTYSVTIQHIEGSRNEPVVTGYLINQEIRAGEPIGLSTENSWEAEQQFDSGIRMIGDSSPIVFESATGQEDFAVKRVGEELHFYEPEDGNKVHFKIKDDTGVDAIYGYFVNGTRIADASGNLFSNGAAVALASASYTKSTSDGRYPTKTGVGATGEWGINISGHAATADSASDANNATNATNADKLGNVSSSGFMRQEYRNSFYGLFPNGTTNTYVRAPQSGLLPYASSQSNGNGVVGTNSWPFVAMYAINFYENGTLLSSKYLGKTAKANTAGVADSAGTATQAGKLYSKGNYTAPFNNGNNTPRSFNSAGVSACFVKGSEGWPISYGKVLNIPSLATSEDGGAMQIMSPYTSSYTGNGNPMFRTGQYQNAGWSAWKTFLDKSWADSLYPTKTGGGASGNWNIRAEKLPIRTSTSTSEYRVAWFSGEYAYQQINVTIRPSDGRLSTRSISATGTINATGYVYGSNIKSTSALKYKDIERRVSLQESLDIVCKIGSKGVAVGEFKDKKKGTGKHRWFIADEVNEVIPEVVGKENGEVENLCYDEMLADAYSAITLLKQEIDELKLPWYKKLWRCING